MANWWEITKKSYDNEEGVAQDRAYNQLAGLLAQAQGGFDSEGNPLAPNATMQSLYDSYAGLQNLGTLGDIGVGGANTGRIGGTQYNYYVMGADNPGEYYIDENGFVTSKSTQRDTNYLNPEAVADIGGGKYAFLTSPQNVPRMVAPAADESMAGEAWGAYGPLILAAAGNVVGPTLNSTFGTLGGSAIKGAVSSALMGGNPLMGAAMGGAGSLAGSMLGGGTGGMNWTNSDSFGGDSSFSTTTTPVDDGSFNTGGFGRAGGNAMFEDWLDGFDLYGDVYSDPNMSGFMGNEAPAPSWLTGGQVGDGLGNLLETPMASSYLDTDSVFGDTGGWPTSDMDSSSVLKQLSQMGPAALRALFGGSGAAAGGSGGRSIFDSILRGLGGTDNDPYGGLVSKGIASAPILAAINYARNNGGMDTSKLDAAYNSFSPEAMTGAYDMASGAGRTNLAANLARRGVMGSSFANADLENYDMSRDVGRSAILGQGATTQANIANQILNAKTAAQKNQFDLYGRSLLALGNVFAPPKSLF